jgi:hypothetical protein
MLVGRNAEPKQGVSSNQFLADNHTTLYSVFDMVLLIFVRTETFEISIQNSSPVLEDGMSEKKPAGTSDDNTLSEVEHLLMRKTFTRYVAA